MDQRDIQKLLDFISKSNLEEVNIETEGIKIKTKRSPSIKGGNATVIQSIPQATSQPNVAQSISQSSEIKPAEPLAIENSKNENLIEIKSPMIGTFYRSSGPDKPPFVEVGDEIEVGKVTCIIEAMKLFNEIESEVKGKIVKILVNDATPVEFDQPLFLVEPS